MIWFILLIVALSIIYTFFVFMVFFDINIFDKKTWE